MSVAWDTVRFMENQLADLRMRSSVRAIAQSFLLILSVTVFSIWGFGWIPFAKLPVSHFWIAIIYRSFTALFWLGVIWALKPRMFKRLFIIRDPLRFLGGFGVVAALTLPQLLHTPYKGHSAWQILEGFVFALFIGIDEELFSRGLIFGFLDKYGVSVAALISSAHFGLLHLGNAIWGGQSFAYTAGQALDAAAFGYLACGLMLFSGTIWIPILLHGIFDFPMQMQSAAVYVHEVTGGTPWAPVIFESFLYGLLGWTLMYLSRLEKSESKSVLSQLFA